MENQLIRTDNLIYKVKRFFRMLFMKNTSTQALEDKVEMATSELQLDKIISCKTEAEKNNIKDELSSKLMKYEMHIKELDIEEIENMIEYFEEDIKNKTDEFEILKKEIIKIKQEGSSK